LFCDFKVALRTHVCVGSHGRLAGCWVCDSCGASGWPDSRLVCVMVWTGQAGSGCASGGIVSRPAFADWAGSVAAVVAAVVRRRNNLGGFGHLDRRCVRMRVCFPVPVVLCVCCGVCICVRECV
jgi:hypothetical protein